MTSRRSLLMSFGAAGLAGSRLLASPKDPWDGKDPAEWTDKEIDKVMNHSPWAKEVYAEMGGGMMTTGMPGGGGRGGGRRGGGGGGGMGADSGGMYSADSTAGMGGGPSGGGRSMGGADMGAQPPGPQIKAMVRWETAAPIRKAAKKDLPKEVAEHYVVSLSTAPRPGLLGGSPGRDEKQRVDPESRRRSMLQRLAASTALERKGKDPIHPEHILTGQDPNRMVFLFLFSREGQPIQVEDKEVVFVSKLGPMEFKAKFKLKDMMYDGKLEL
jgi:hypothetical protein